MNQLLIALVLGRSNSALMCDLWIQRYEAIMDISFIEGTKNQNLNLEFIRYWNIIKMITPYDLFFLLLPLPLRAKCLVSNSPSHHTIFKLDNSMIYCAIFEKFYY